MREKKFTSTYYAGIGAMLTVEICEAASFSCLTTTYEDVEDDEDMTHPIGLQRGTGTSTCAGKRPEHKRTRRIQKMTNASYGRVKMSTRRTLSSSLGIRVITVCLAALGFGREKVGPGLILKPRKSVKISGDGRRGPHDRSRLELGAKTLRTVSERTQNVEIARATGALSLAHTGRPFRA